jgi:hypothetical protein
LVFFERSLFVSVLEVRGGSSVFAEVLNECAKLCQAFERKGAMAGGRGGAAALGHVRKLVADMVRDELAAGARKNSTEAMPRELVVQYVVGAYMAILTWWLDGGAKLPPERIDAMFRCLATDGVMPSYP